MAPWPEQGNEPKAPDKEDKREVVEANVKVGEEESTETTISTKSDQKSDDKEVLTLDEGQLKALLDEAITYKNPKDREGKSELFKELLQEAEADESDSKGLGNSIGGKLPRAYYNNLPVRRRQSRHGGQSREYGVGVSSTRGGSLQNLHALGMEGGRRSRKRDTLVSARQREGGSLPTNVNVDNDPDMDIIRQNYTSRATLEVSGRTEETFSKEPNTLNCLKAQGHHYIPNGNESAPVTKEDDNRVGEPVYASSLKKKRRRPKKHGNSTTKMGNLPDDEICQREDESLIQTAESNNRLWHRNIPKYHDTCLCEVVEEEDPTKNKETASSNQTNPQMNPNTLENAVPDHASVSVKEDKTGEVFHEDLDYDSLEQGMDNHSHEEEMYYDSLEEKKSETSEEDNGEDGAYDSEDTLSADELNNSPLESPSSETDDDVQTVDLVESLEFYNQAFETLYHWPSGKVGLVECVVVNPTVFLDEEVVNNSLNLQNDCEVIGNKEENSVIEENKSFDEVKYMNERNLQKSMTNNDNVVYFGESQESGNILSLVKENSDIGPYWIENPFEFKFKPECNLALSEMERKEKSQNSKESQKIKEPIDPVASSRVKDNNSSIITRHKLTAMERRSLMKKVPAIRRAATAMERRKLQLQGVGPVESGAMLYPSTQVQHVSVLSIPPSQIHTGSDDHRTCDSSEAKKLNVSRSRQQKKSQSSEEPETASEGLLGLPLTAYWNRYSSFTLLDFQGMSNGETRTSRRFNLACGSSKFDPRPKPYPSSPVSFAVAHHSEVKEAHTTPVYTPSNPQNLPLSIPSDLQIAPRAGPSVNTAREYNGRSGAAETNAKISQSKQGKNQVGTCPVVITRVNDRDAQPSKEPQKKQGKNQVGTSPVVITRVSAKDAQTSKKPQQTKKEKDDATTSQVAHNPSPIKDASSCKKQKETKKENDDAATTQAALNIPPTEDASSCKKQKEYVCNTSAEETKKMNGFICTNCSEVLPAEIFKVFTVFGDPIICRTISNHVEKTCCASDSQSLKESISRPSKESTILPKESINKPLKNFANKPVNESASIPAKESVNDLSRTEIQGTLGSETPQKLVLPHTDLVKKHFAELTTQPPKKEASTPRQESLLLPRDSVKKPFLQLPNQSTRKSASKHNQESLLLPRNSVKKSSLELPSLCPKHAASVPRQESPLPLKDRLPQDLGLRSSKKKSKQMRKEAKKKQKQEKLNKVKEGSSEKKEGGSLNTQENPGRVLLIPEEPNLPKERLTGRSLQDEPYVPEHPCLPSRHLEEHELAEIERLTGRSLQDEPYVPEHPCLPSRHLEEHELAEILLRENEKVMDEVRLCKLELEKTKKLVSMPALSLQEIGTVPRSLPDPKVPPACKKNKQKLSELTKGSSPPCEATEALKPSSTSDTASAVPPSPTHTETNGMKSCNHQSAAAGDLPQYLDHGYITKLIEKTRNQYEDVLRLSSAFPSTSRDTPWSYTESQSSRSAAHSPEDNTPSIHPGSRHTPQHLPETLRLRATPPGAEKIMRKADPGTAGRSNTQHMDNHCGSHDKGSNNRKGKIPENTSPFVVRRVDPAIAERYITHMKSHCNSHDKGSNNRRDSNTRLAFGNTADGKTKPVDENGNALACVRMDSNCLDRKKQRRVKAKNDRNTILSDEIEGFRGGADIDTLMEYIESPSLEAKSSKNRTNQANGPRNSVKVRAKEEEPRSIKRRKERLQRCNSLEEISKTKLEDLTEESTSERVNGPSHPITKKQITVDDAELVKKFSWDVIVEPAKISDTKDQKTERISPETVQESEFHVVTKKQRKKKRRAGCSSRGVSKQDYYSGREAGSGRLLYQYRRDQRASQPRRKSASSVPPSDKSDSSDLDSVHSLPVSSSTATTRARQNSMSGGSTPQASYADIAKTAASPPDGSQINIYRQDKGSPNSSLSESCEKNSTIQSSLPLPLASSKKDAMTDTNCDTSPQITSEDYPPLEVRSLDFCTETVKRSRSGVRDNFVTTDRVNVKTDPVIPCRGSGDGPQSLPSDISCVKSSDISHNKRPPVILMHDPSRGDSRVPELEFGFPVNYQLLQNEIVECSEAEQSAPPVSSLPTSAPIDRDQGCYSFISDQNLVQYLSTSWEEILEKLRSGKARYYSDGQ